MLAGVMATRVLVTIDYERIVVVGVSTAAALTMSKAARRSSLEQMV